MRQATLRIEQVWQEHSASPIPVVKQPSEALRPHIPDVADKLLDQAIKKLAPTYPLIALETQNSSPREFFIRVLDVAGSIIVTLLTLVPMAIVTLLIKITSRGPVLYKQKRVGKAGKIFTLYKFRTMINDAEKDLGPVLASRDDPRVTPIGRVLRSTRIDELPQLFNILQGDMSLVGPRPERPHFVKRHQVLQGPRLSVKPGLTGLAQIRSFYDLKPSHKIKYDYIYLRKRSTLLNIYILLQTVPVIFFKKGW